MMACNNNVTKGVMPMGKSQRETVVGGFGLVPDPQGSHYILEGEVSKPWSRGHRNVVARL